MCTSHSQTFGLRVWEIPFPTNRKSCRNVYYMVRLWPTTKSSLFSLSIQSCLSSPHAPNRSIGAEDITNLPQTRAEQDILPLSLLWQLAAYAIHRYYCICLYCWHYCCRCCYCTRNRHIAKHLLQLHLSSRCTVNIICVVVIVFILTLCSWYYTLLAVLLLLTGVRALTCSDLMNYTLIVAICNRVDGFCLSVHATTAHITAVTAWVLLLLVFFFLNFFIFNFLFLYFILCLIIFSCHNDILLAWLFLFLFLFGIYPRKLCCWYNFIYNQMGKGEGEGEGSARFIPFLVLPKTQPKLAKMHNLKFSYCNLERCVEERAYDSLCNETKLIKM